MKMENVRVYNIDQAVYSIRNSMNSWAQSDTNLVNGHIGPKDLELATRLVRSGASHRKFLRQIFVTMDLTAPLYFWKEADQYKVGTTTNSTSTMHKLASSPITLDCFEIGDYNNLDIQHEDASPYEVLGSTGTAWEALLEVMEGLRQAYLATKDIRYWKELVRILPESWLQMRTWSMSYENLYNIAHQRKGHKLSEWAFFLDQVKGFPYAEAFIFAGSPSDS